MPEIEEIIAGTSFNTEEGVQTVYGSLFSFGDLSTSGSVVINPTSSLLSPNDSLPGQIACYEQSNISSLYFFDGVSYNKINISTNFNYDFGGGDPLNEVFLVIPTGSNNERAFTFKYLLTSGSTAASIGQGQILGDGSVAVVDLFATTSLSGGATASINAIYSGSGIALRATFLGPNYIISGSYNSII